MEISETDIARIKIEALNELSDILCDMKSIHRLKLAIGEEPTSHHYVHYFLTLIAERCKDLEGVVEVKS